MGGFDQLVAVQVPHRQATRLAGVSRAPAARRHTRGEPAQLPHPGYPGDAGEQAHPGRTVGGVVGAQLRPVCRPAAAADRPTMLEEGRYLCSVLTM